ncbi:PREDICTED: BAHD acyltransferase At5g47980-like isoform X1 [Camelina sativa]|uniref:BAHD acyltransferase At5g47980-like isoform X1 n=1 Tax=Camelina sativa TaxID=90675 RepID=A0ABM0YLQ4_CAMSA|nr:PREDICTED: BAHD acyltransferase At5g47980-like isoform X1 [Camelina sativa]
MFSSSKEETTMDTVKVETIGREIIKPSIPTPNDLRTLQLSFMDQIIAPVYAVAFLFYTKDDLISQEQASQTLKTSLSETLTKFHPFAGRVNGFTIDSSDEGAVFVDARVDCTLSNFLRDPDMKSLQKLLPVEAAETNSAWPLLLVQATYFKCGGMAIGIGICHKLGDAAALSYFIQFWAATARGESDSVANPDFVFTKLYPPANEIIKIAGEDQLGKRKSVTKRFVFVASKIEELKKKVASDAVPRPTRVQSLTSLIWKCVVAASTDTIREKVLYQANNLRSKIPTLLSENLMGNPLYSTLTLNGKGQMESVEIVKELQKRNEELSHLIQHKEGSSGSSGLTVGSKLLGAMADTKFSYELYDMHVVTSWCKIPLYKTCFGWGFPVWFPGNVSPILENVTVLIDSKDGQGVEAWVTLPQEEMLRFEQSTELLYFASPNPRYLLSKM